MELVDTRRLPGPNLLWLRPGAVIDVAVSPQQSPGLVNAWERQARCILDAVGWVGEKTCVRTFSGGASLAISAPLDAMYAATEVNEWAFETARASLVGEPVEGSTEVGERLRRIIAEETNPRLIALREAALARGVDFLSDDSARNAGLLPFPGCITFALWRTLQHVLKNFKQRQTVRVYRQVSSRHHQL